jgi:hypothetical protein
MDSPHERLEPSGVVEEVAGECERGEGSRGIWIGAAAVVVAAVIGGIFALVAASRSNSPVPSPTTTVPAPPSDTTTVTATTGEDPTTTYEPTTSEGTPPSPARVDSVTVEAGEYRKVGARLYQLNGSKTLEFRYWWTTITDYGEIDSGDTSCTVVGTITNLATRAVVHRARSATCSLQGWQSAYLPQGRYRVAVAVTLESGTKGTGEMVFTIIP